MLDYVDEIYQTYVRASQNGSLKIAYEQLNKMAPAPMNTMLEKERREIAVMKRNARKTIVVEDMPPTTPGA